MRYLIAATVCLCLCIGGCCVLEKAFDEMGNAIGEALARALTQHYIADLMDPSLTCAEVAGLRCAWSAAGGLAVVRWSRNHPVRDTEAGNCSDFTLRARDSVPSERMRIHRLDLALCAVA